MSSRFKAEGAGSTGMAITMVYPIIKTIAHKGYDPEQFCRYASFDSGMLHNADARIADEELERLTIAAAAFTKDDHFGLNQGQLMEIADMGILGYVMMHSGCIAEALSAYRRYNDILCSSFQLDWETAGDDVVLRLFLQGENGRLSRHCVEDMASSLYHLIGKLSNRRFPLHEVVFTHAAPDDTAPYAAVFGVTPRFDADINGLRFSRDVLNYPILYSNAKLRSMFEAVVEETREELHRGNTLSGQIFQWMTTCMPAYFPTLLQTAETFEMSTRSLQNNLKEEGTSYNELSARVRKELAKRYLGKVEFSVGDIAYALHFSEPSAFQSAFKKWTGLTPGQYRSQLR